MSALAPPLAFYTQNTAAQAETSAPSEASLYELLNRLMEAVGDRSLYEDIHEPRPGAGAVVTAAVTLSRLNDRFRDTLEIEPFWGQLSLVWRSGRERRVKATFGGDGRLSIYYEQMIDGRVIDSGMDTPQDNFTGHLANRLIWLRS